MRLWHQDLLPYLSQQRIQGQHRECCAMRGKGWNEPHETVDYVWNHRPFKLVMYHLLVMDIGEDRFGINFNDNWFLPMYRGKKIGYDESGEWITTQEADSALNYYYEKPRIYPEHNDNYLLECINNLKDKGVDVSEMKSELLDEVA